MGAGYLSNDSQIATDYERPNALPFHPILQLLDVLDIGQFRLLKPTCPLDFKEFVGNRPETVGLCHHFTLDLHQSLKA